MNNQIQSEISHLLIRWYNENKRDLPWRETNDPYKIWVSEVMLQQTRVAQGLNYYLRFIEKFPSVKLLAQSSEKEVL
ncbi:MAG: A/G-specific adenine glycosylase, partial [Dysgonamonadaceae bacterium]|nr:A/G-specific adenine glycosylase [Dysgonamonadaceae bacterium]